MKVKTIVCLICMLLVCGCGDPVGGKDFICPVCQGDAILFDLSDDYDNKAFKFECQECFTKSGRFKSFIEVIKIWKVKEGEGAK